MTDKTTKVVVCIPSMTFWYAEFGASVVSMFKQTIRQGTNVDLVLAQAKCSVIHVARHSLAAGCLENYDDLDYLLWLDTDQTFPPDTLLRLLAHDVDMVGCAISSRSSPRRLNARMIREDGTMGLPDLAVPGLVPVHRIGFGVVLTSASLFRAIDPPWFDIKWNLDNPDQPHIGEDYMFCKKVIDAGFDIWCDAPLSWEVGHLGTTEYTLDIRADARKIATMAGNDGGGFST